MKGYIYKLTSPSGLSYVGRTVDLKTRMAHYRAKSNQDKSPIYREVGKYGFENIKKEILEIVEADSIYKLNELLNERERDYIEKLDTVNHGLNQRKYDSVVRVFKISDETKEKMRKSHIGKKHSQESRDKRAGANAYQSKRVASDKLGKSFVSLKEAAKYAGITNGCKISEVITGKRKAAGRNPDNGIRIDDWRFE